MRDDRLEDQAESALRKILDSVPFINRVEVEHRSPEHGFDLIAAVHTGDKSYNLVLDVRSNGQPRMVRSAIAVWQSWHLREKLRNGHFVFAAPYVSESSREICREAGIGYLDFSGNCLLSFDQIFIERFGHQKEAEKRELQSIFHEKGSRAVRRLLHSPGHHWHVQELAAEAQISTGLASQIKNKLIDSELVFRSGDMFVLNRPAELLKRWSEEYRFKKNQSVEFYSNKALPETDELIAEHCNRNGISYGFTLFSGARLIGAQYVRVVPKSNVYVLTDPESLGIELGLKRVESGGNIVLMKPYDDDLLYGKNRINDEWAVSDIQLYLDFSAQKGRTQETAEFLMDSRISPKWEQEMNETIS